MNYRQMPRSVVLLSGGMDSAVNFKCAASVSHIASAITFDYGQRAANAEIRAAGEMCARLGVRSRLISLPWLAQISPAALTDASAPLPRLEAALLDNPQGAAAASAELVWVPNRNGVFLNIAASLAEALGAGTVHVGFNAEEAATFPDNSAGFLDAANAALRFSTKGAVRIVCDTIAMEKAEIVKLGLDNGAPLDLAWPCYDGGERMCGACESCLRFMRAAERAGAAAWFTEHHKRLPANWKVCGT